MDTKRNKKNITLAILLILLVNCAYSSLALNTHTSNTIDHSNDTEMKNWTWMFYDDSDFFNAYEPLNDFAAKAYSGENLDVIVLEDTNHGFGKIYQIDENHNKILLKRLGETNMGGYRALRDFIKYGKENFPAERYFLSVYNHGMAWKGACIDITFNLKGLPMNGFQKALSQTGGVDIICFTAPCLMGSLEAVYELKDLVDVYIGSEEGSGYCYWAGTIDNICDMLNNETQLSNIEIGEQIIQLIEDLEDKPEWYQPEWSDTLTMSAVRTDKITNLTDAINILSRNLTQSDSSIYQKIESAHTQTFQFAGGAGDSIEVYDFYNFTENLLNQEGLDANIINDIENVQKTFNETIIAETHGCEMNGSNGLSIYFPDKVKLWKCSPLLYRSRLYGLDFPRDTYWDEFLFRYILTSIFL